MNEKENMIEVNNVSMRFNLCIEKGFSIKQGFVDFFDKLTAQLPTLSIYNQNIHFLLLFLLNFFHYNRFFSAILDKTPLFFLFPIIHKSPP